MAAFALAILLMVLAPAAGCQDRGANHAAGSFWSGGKTSASSSAVAGRVLLAQGGSPKVVVDQPRRGEQIQRARLPGGILKVKGRAQNPDGSPASVEVGGRPVIPDGQGVFEQDVTLVPGVNTIAIQATGSNGNITLAHRSVVYGDFLDLDQPVPDALGLRLSASGMPAIQRALEQQVRGLDLEAYLRGLNPVYRGSGSYFLIPYSLEVEAWGLAYKQVDVQLLNRPGALGCTVTLHQFAVNTKLTGKVAGLGIAKTGTVTADRLGASLELLVGLDRQGRITVAAQKPGVLLSGLKLTLNEPGLIVGMFTGKAQDMIRDNLQDAVLRALVTELPRVVEQYLNGLLQRPAKQVGNVQLAWRAVPRLIALDAGGLSLMGDVNVEAPMRTLMPAVAGSYHTPAPAWTVQTAKDAAIQVADDFINRVLCVAWHSGLLELRVDQGFLDRVSGGPAPFRMEGALLLQHLPSLAGAVQPTDALEARVHVDLPPLLRIAGKPDLLDLQIGELVVDVERVRGGQRELLLSVANHLSLDASFQVQGDQVHIVTQPLTKLRTNVLAEPVADIHDGAAETLMQLFVQPLVPELTKVLKDLHLPTLGSIQLQQAEFKPVGPSGDFLLFDALLR